MLKPLPRRIVRPPVRDRLLFVPDHALLAGGHGQLSDGSLFGRVELASFGLSGCAITQDILRLIPKMPESEFLLAYLSTGLGQRLLKSTAIGTSIPLARLDLVSQLPLPDADATIRGSITTHVQAAVDARKKAALSENAAISLIEEKVLPAWLN